MADAKQIFLGRNSYALSLLATTLDHFGTECLDWDVVTLRMEIERDFDIKLPGYNEDRLNCAISLLTTNLFKVSVEHFFLTCSTLSRGVAVASSLTIPNSYDIMWGITEANLIVGKDDSEENFSHDIARAVGVVLDSEGIYSPPNLLSFCEYKEGLLDSNFMALSQNESDYAFYYQNQATLKDNLNGAVKEHMLSLFTELRSLPLKNPDNTFLDKVLTQLKSSPTT